MPVLGERHGSAPATVTALSRIDEGEEGMATAGKEARRNLRDLADDGLIVKAGPGPGRVSACVVGTAGFKYRPVKG
ncbi:hypothetical protein ACFVWP_03455 [Streptomyces sp. NPDC058175]|uniref:hypothetical protein n=1 Tax=Streptomyces sp. NPDC058175 TaxID=3346367 RepID=UPI0036E41C89